MTLFPGKRWVHGVTPLERVRKDDGYRISIVYYALRGMKDCRTYAEETAKAQINRTEREAAMAKRMAAGDMQIPGKTPDKPLRQAFAGWRRTGAGDNVIALLFPLNCPGPVGGASHTITPIDTVHPASCVAWSRSTVQAWWSRSEAAALLPCSHLAIG